ncbi:hypothetical protein TorRG33x02_144630 [Trema orientale]|uniref:Pollen Ole e 1 allergen and extensin family protein n=1 Tax=Trema orientale TaxID=63057 RepID=A0A2P5EW68_TREOI|nr:hypothetical protein TorRG33x02_144630 [Trema orientale]
MAYQTQVLLAIASLLIAMSSVAPRILPNLNLPDVTNNNNGQPGVRIPGVLKCTRPVNCPGTPNLVAGVKVNVILTCDGRRTYVTNAVTDPSGFFQIVLDSSSSILFGASNTNECRVTARLPVIACVVFLPTGILDGPLVPVQTITDELLGNAIGQDVTTRPCTVNPNNDQSKVRDDHVLSTGDQSSYDQSTLYDDHHIAYTGTSSYHSDHSTMQANIHT